MKLPDILSAFHGMPTCDRLDLICRLLRSCVPYELRFLGTVILDAAQAQMKSFSGQEVVANQVSHYAGFKTSGVTHGVCESLCCALAVVHAHNHPVAEAVFGLLDNQQALQLFEETSDLKILDDFRLLYVMAVNHPALSFTQRQHLLYRYLQRMDSLYCEKRRQQMARNLTSSSESGDGGDGSATLRREPGRDASMTYCEVHSVYKRQPDKRYAYMIQVEWSDGTSCCVRRTYGDFFSFHTKLLDQFPEEGGQKNKKERMIPFLPGKSYPRILTNRNNRDLAEKRLPELHRYAKELLLLPEKISQCKHVLEFFRPRRDDLREEYPSVDKITTLYDLLESGKARMRNYTDPLVSKGSPGHSPQLPNSSPLHRASAETTPTTQSRTSHTLPHASSSSTSQPKEEAGLERRFTYPSRRSAFTPVALPTQQEATPTSTHLTNSQPSIANGGSPSTVATETTTTKETISTTPVEQPSSAGTSLKTSPSSSSSQVTSITSSQPHPSPSTTGEPTSAVSVITADPHLPPAPSPPSSSSATSQPLTSIAKPTPTYAPSHSSHHYYTSPSSVQSGKTTPLGEVTYSVPLPVGPPMVPLFNPIIMGYHSPIHSPSPSPLTPGVLRGKSSSNICRTPTEYDSLTRWLKSLRLHKYAPIFENMTFDELLAVDKATLKKKNMTEGAANKLLGKIEELKAHNFTGFRDMPFSRRMSRKPSTCSLPAALLTADNRVMTPSSSVDGLSPTDSTCSLDKATLIVSQTSGGQADMYYPLNGSASSQDPVYDFQSLSQTGGGGGGRGRDGTLKSSVVSPSLSLTSPSSPHPISPAELKSTLTRSGVSSSWADRLDVEEDEREIQTPEWAQLRRDETSTTDSLTYKHPRITSKQHSEPAGGWSQADPTTPARHHHPVAWSGGWLQRQPPTNHMHSSTGRRHRGQPHSATPLGVNGLIPSLTPSLGIPPVLQRPTFIPAAAPSLMPTPYITNHSRGSPHPPPPVCFNCGKKGHLGMSCPADTIDTHNPDMFHRQLEKLATARQTSHGHQHT